jgi:transcription antitermination factor NusG
MSLEPAGAAAPSTSIEPKSWEAVAASGKRNFWEHAAVAPAWYIVEAIPGKEFELAVSLQVAFEAFGEGAEILHLVDVFRMQRRIVANGRVESRKVIRKISRFGPLIFLRVALTKGLCQALVNMPLAHSVMRCKDGERPVVVADAMIRFYRAVPNAGALVEATEIGVGDVVRIVEGPAIGALGVVERVDNGRALRLDTSKFGGLAPLMIEASHVELVELCRKRPIKPSVRDQAKRKRA